MYKSIKINKDYKCHKYGMSNLLEEQEVDIKGRR